MTNVSPNKTPKVALALHEAVHQADLKQVLALLEAGANPNHQADELQGCSPLHVACLLHGQACHGHRHHTAEVLNVIAGHLLKHGAVVTLRDHQYRVPAALAEGFTPKCVREAMATKAEAMPGIFDPVGTEVSSEHARTMMRDHRLSKVEPLGGGPLYLAEQTPLSDRRDYYAERQRRVAHYTGQMAVNVARAHEEELAACRAALVRLGLGQSLVVHEVRA